MSVLEASRPLLNVPSSPWQTSGVLPLEWLAQETEAPVVPEQRQMSPQFTTDLPPDSYEYGQLAAIRGWRQRGEYLYHLSELIIHKGFSVSFSEFSDPEALQKEATPGFDAFADTYYACMADGHITPPAQAETGSALMPPSAPEHPWPENDVDTTGQPSATRMAEAPAEAAGEPPVPNPKLVAILFAGQERIANTQTDPHRYGQHHLRGSEVSSSLPGAQPPTPDSTLQYTRPPLDLHTPLPRRQPGAAMQPTDLLGTAAPVITEATTRNEQPLHARRRSIRRHLGSTMMQLFDRFRSVGKVPAKRRGLTTAKF